MPLPLALFIPFSFGRGIERVTVTLAQALVERGVEVEVVVGRANGPYFGELKGTARVVDLGVGRTFATLPGLTHYLRLRRPQAVLSAPDSASVIALWARRLARVDTSIVTVTHTVLSESLKHKSGPYRRTFPHLVRRTYPSADAIVAVSEWVAADLAKMARLSRFRIQVIPNPVVDERLLAQAREPVAHAWFESRTAPVILSVGRLNEEKNYGDLLLAFARLRQERRVRLIILGNGTEREHLVGLAAKLGVADDVEFPGFASNPYGYMARASLFALSSKYEALPTVLVEAMACGCPVVAVDCPGGVREVLRGRYGSLVPMGDSELMAQAFAETLDNPPDSESLRQRAMDFHVDRAVGQYLQVLGL